MSYLKINSNSFTVPGDSTYYDALYRIAYSVATENNIDDVSNIEMDITDKQASIRYKTAFDLMGMLGGLGANIYDIVENHPAVSAGVISWILAKAQGKDDAMKEAMEGFIAGWITDSPIAGVAFAQTMQNNGIVASILAAAGGMLGDGLLKSILGNPSKKSTMPSFVNRGEPGIGGAAFGSPRMQMTKYAEENIYQQAAAQIQKMMSSGNNDPLAMLAFIEKNIASFPQVISQFMGEFTKTVGEFFSKIFDGGEAQQAATQAVNSNPDIAKGLKEAKDKADPNKQKTSTGVATSTGDTSTGEVLVEQAQATPPDPTAQPAQTGMATPDANVQPTTESTLNQTTNKSPTSIPVRGASEQYTNPFRTIFTKRAE